MALFTKRAIIVLLTAVIVTVCYGLKATPVESHQYMVSFYGKDLYKSIPQPGIYQAENKMTEVLSSPDGFLLIARCKYSFIILAFLTGLALFITVNRWWVCKDAED